MAATDIKPFFQTHLNVLKLREWKDGFNWENNPSTILDKSYHLEFPRGYRDGAYDMATSDIRFEVTVRVFLKGFRNPADSIQEAIRYWDLINARILASANRAGTEIKNIYFDSHQIIPLSASNDNVAILEMTFSCFIIICI